MTLYVKQNLSALWGWRNLTPGISIRKDFQLFSITVQLWFDEWSKWRMAVIAKDVKLRGVHVYKGTSPGWCLLKNDEVNFKSLIWWLELKTENVGHSYRRKWTAKPEDVDPKTREDWKGLSTTRNSRNCTIDDHRMWTGRVQHGEWSLFLLFAEWTPKSRWHVLARVYSAKNRNANKKMVWTQE